VRSARASGDRRGNAELEPSFNSFDMALRLCVSVSLSVTRRCSTKIAKSYGSRTQNYTIAQGLQFSDAKDLREIPPGSPPAGAPSAGGVG